MGKKEKAVLVLAEDFKAMVPKLEAFLKVHNEIAAGYQKYRKDGGVAIPGIEKHLGSKKEALIPSTKAAKATKNKKDSKANAPQEVVAVKKAKKKVKV